VPFTFAHPAVAIPLRRTRLLFSALIVGTLAPDFHYFLPIVHTVAYAHTLSGAFLVDLPLALIVLWLFQHVVRDALIALLPDSIQSRWHPAPNLRFTDLSTFALAIVSALAGIFTHLLWDSLTHPALWVEHTWSLPGHPLRLTHWLPHTRLLQNLSTVGGFGIVLLSLLHWYSTTLPRPIPGGKRLPPLVRAAILTTIVGIAALGALHRAYLLAGGPAHHLSRHSFAREAGIGLIAFVWWELVVYGTIVTLATYPSRTAT
jgi:hypothetical protein